MLPFLIQYYQNHSFYSIIAIVLYFIFYALYGLYIQHFVIIFRPAIYSTFCDNISSSIVWSILSVQCFIVVSPYNKWVLLPPPSRQHGTPGFWVHLCTFRSTEMQEWCRLPLPGQGQLPLLPQEGGEQPGKAGSESPTAGK